MSIFRNRVLLAGLLISLLAILCTACIPASNTGTANPTVHMNEMQFVPGTITLKKGTSLTLMDDGAVVHIIANGRWDSNGTQRPAIEPGAPVVQQVQFNGNDQQIIGPFSTAGTFHLYCTIHVNMNLIVQVQ